MQELSWLPSSTTLLKLEAKVHTAWLTIIGTQRRKKKHVSTQVVSEDKKLMSAIKKFGMSTSFSAYCDC